MDLLTNSFAPIARYPKKRVFLFSMITLLLFPAICNAATVYITADTNWSAITGGCSGSVPCAGDAVIVENAANLTVDVNNAQCASLKLGDATTAPKGNGTITFAANSALVVHGAVTFGDNTTNPTRNGTLDMTLGGTLTCNGFSVVSIGTVTPGTGTVILDATNTLPPNAKLGTFNNLTINSGTTTLGRATVINGDLIIKGTLDDSTSNYTISVSGNWDSSLGTFIAETGIVRFLGASATPQTIKGNISFYHLTINNTGGGVNLAGDTTVTNTLTMTSGNLVLGNNDLVIDIAATVTGASATNYIQADGTGVMRKNFDASWIGTAFTFPIGDVSNYSRLSITLNSATFVGGDYISVRVTPSMEPKLNGTGDYIKRYWTVNSGGFSAINYNVSYWYVDADIVGTETNMLQQTWNGSNWSSYGTVVAGSDRVNGNNITALPSNFDFTAAGASALLPVELLNFDAKADGGVVNIAWTTASETNNDYFTVEKSSDGIDFEILTTVHGAGNSNVPIYYKVVDKNPLRGTSYYRLKQTDFNGANKTFSPVVVNYNDQSSNNFTVFPNPSNGHSLSVALSGFRAGTEVQIIINDILGKELYSGTVTISEDGSATNKIDLRLIPGDYIVSGFANGMAYSKKLLVR